MRVHGKNPWMPAPFSFRNSFEWQHVIKVSILLGSCVVILSEVWEANKGKFTSKYFNKEELPMEEELRDLPRYRKCTRIVFPID